MFSTIVSFGSNMSTIAASTTKDAIPDHFDLENENGQAYQKIIG